MKLERHRPYGYAHIKEMERSGDVRALIDTLDVPAVKEAGRLRHAVVSALGRIGSNEAVAVVVDLLLSDPEESVRRAAARALGQLGDTSALPALRLALADESKRVQLWAVRSIGLLRGRESIDQLVEMLDSPDWGFRSYAAGALGEIGDQRATEPLLRHIQDPKGTVQIGVLSALRKLGDSRAIDPLRKARDAKGWWRRRRIAVTLRDLEARFGASLGHMRSSLEGSIDLRPPTPAERKVLLALLKEEFPGRDALLDQVPGLVVRAIDNEGSLELKASGSKADIRERVPVEAALEDVDGFQIHILLHVLDGVMCELEVYKDNLGVPQRELDPDSFNLFAPYSSDG